jgi:hypothetical protein
MFGFSHLCSGSSADYAYTHCAILIETAIRTWLHPLQVPYIIMSIRGVTPLFMC